MSETHSEEIYNEALESNTNAEITTTITTRDSFKSGRVVGVRKSDACRLCGEQYRDVLVVDGKIKCPSCGRSF